MNVRRLWPKPDPVSVAPFGFHTAVEELINPGLQFLVRYLQIDLPIPFPKLIAPTQHRERSGFPATPPSELSGIVVASLRRQLRWFGIVNRLVLGERDPWQSERNIGNLRNTWGRLDLKRPQLFGNLSCFWHGLDRRQPPPKTSKSILSS